MKNKKKKILIVGSTGKEDGFNKNIASKLAKDGHQAPFTIQIDNPKQFQDVDLILFNCSDL